MDLRPFALLNLQPQAHLQHAAYIRYYVMAQYLARLLEYDYLLVNRLPCHQIALTETSVEQATNVC